MHMHIHMQRYIDTDTHLRTHTHDVCKYMYAHKSILIGRKSNDFFQRRRHVCCSSHFPEEASFGLRTDSSDPPLMRMLRRAGPRRVRMTSRTSNQSVSDRSAVARARREAEVLRRRLSILDLHIERAWHLGDADFDRLHELWAAFVAAGRAPAAAELRPDAEMSGSKWTHTGLAGYVPAFRVMPWAVDGEQPRVGQDVRVARARARARAALGTQQLPISPWEASLLAPLSPHRPMLDSRGNPQTHQC